MWICSPVLFQSFPSLYLILSKPEDPSDWLQRKRALSSPPTADYRDSCRLSSLPCIESGTWPLGLHGTHRARIMAATHSDYRGYLRNTVDIEAGQHRFHPVQSSEPTYRPLLFGTLAVMGLLQVASSVAILLHLTGYLQEVDLSTAPHRPIEEVQTEPVLNALRDPRKKGRCKTPKESLASAHLPVKVPQEYSKKGEQKAITIDWNEMHGHCHKMGYQKGKLQVIESGFYYIYAKTCFRYYVLLDESSSQAGVTPVDVSNTQLIQYVYREIIKQNSKSVLLMKTGSTMRWNNTSYNMYCAQQGLGVRLEEGDALYVNVSNAWMLDLEGEGTYFGAIKLGN